ncbi:HpcH/HpaI aldolase family protein [Microbulbifer litoralis]|uniref:HpcH/HpaI aldolase family protein n=1 Tax=Microbulbifer litoralis TaxID=2933965 RepID=UPI0020283F42|nr:aldolase/citrate lyase family protein [Microbulbifer sp. GX H0434]
MSSSLKARMQNGERLHGLFCCTPSSLLVEFIAHAGFDYVVLDTEHSLVNPADLDHMIVAARASGIAALVRVPIERGDLVAPLLDAGAEGIVFPRICSEEEAVYAATLCHYPPSGKRGLSVHRHIGYHSDRLQERNRRADEGVLVAAMIEDRAGLESCKAIAGVSGIDILMEGAADLSASLGVPWQTRHPTVIEGLERIAAAAAAAGIAFCAIPREGEDYWKWLDRGVSLFLLGTDRGVIRKSLAAHLEKYTGAAGGPR